MLKFVLKASRTVPLHSRWPANRPIPPKKIPPLFGYNKFKFSDLESISSSIKSVVEQEPFYFYKQFLIDPEYIKVFEFEAKNAIKQLINHDKLDLKKFVNILLTAEKNIANYYMKKKKKNDFLHKWEIRKQLRKAILLNLQYEFQKDKSQKVIAAFGCFQKIQILQGFISQNIVDYIVKLNDILNIYATPQQRKFMEQDSYTEGLIKMLQKLSQTDQDFKSLQLGKNNQVKDYIFSQFFCLFDAKAQPNYSEAFLASIQGRYKEGMIQNKLVFNITSLTATVFKSIFTSVYQSQSISATKRIGKSIALLLARILCQYPTENRYIFFQNLNEFKQINKANLILVQMIRHLWWDRLYQKDFRILDMKITAQIEKKVSSSSQNIELLKEFDNLCESFYEKIQSIDLQEQKKYIPKSKQNKTLQNKAEKPFSIRNPNNRLNQLNQLVYFHNLLSLIRRVKDKNNCYLILDQFNYVGRNMYQIISFKQRGLTTAKKLIINSSLRQLTLANLFIQSCGQFKVRYFSSINNYSFQKLLELLDKHFNRQTDSYTVFGFSYSGQNAKYQLWFELNKMFQQIGTLQKNTKQVYQAFISKNVINIIVDSLELALDGSSIRSLAQKLMEVFGKFTNTPLTQISSCLNVLNKDIIINKDDQNGQKHSKLSNIKEQFISQLKLKFKLVYQQQRKHIENNLKIFINQSLSNQEKSQKYLILGFAAYMIQNNKKDGVKLSSFSDYINNLSEMSPNMPKSQNQKFIVNLLSLFKFYYSLNGEDLREMRFSLGYEKIWLDLAASNLTQIGKAVELLTIESFVVNQLYKFHQKGSYQQIFGNQLQQDVFNSIEKTRIAKTQVFIGNQTFSIDESQVLNRHLNLLNDTKDILKNVKNQRYTKAIKCAHNQEASDQLIVRVILNQKSEPKSGTIQYFFIELGINGQNKIKTAAQKIQKAYFKSVDPKGKTKLQKVRQQLSKMLINQKLYQIELKEVNLILLAPLKEDEKEKFQQKQYPDFKITAMPLNQFDEKNKTITLPSKLSLMYLQKLSLLQQQQKEKVEVEKSNKKKKNESAYI